jgi:hypothetical protein
MQQNTITPYLAKQLVKPYHTTNAGVTKLPYHLISWWVYIFDCVGIHDPRERMQLRSFCRLFRDSLRPPQIWTTFPSEHIHSLNDLVAKARKARNIVRKNENEIKHSTLTSTKQLLVLLEEGEHFIQETTGDGRLFSPRIMNYLKIDFPIIFHGLGEESTTIVGGFEVEGLNKLDDNKVIIQDLAIRNSHKSGVFLKKSLPLAMINVKISDCGWNSVCLDLKSTAELHNVQGINCGFCGILCTSNSTATISGIRTKFTLNGFKHYNSYGLLTGEGQPGTILIKAPLTKEKISFRNRSGHNYGGPGEIIQIEAELCFLSPSMTTKKTS